MIKLRILYSYSYDLFVIGGGSGGLAASKSAALLNKKVGLADFVTPTAHGTTWGTGGTCVNVGCIPKKLMHIAAQLGEIRSDQEQVGWGKSEVEHDWSKLIQNIQNTISKLNNLHKKNLMRAGVEFHNKKAKLLDAHTIQLTDAVGVSQTITSENIILAVGTRPTQHPTISPSDYITSDDLFSKQSAPGKTIIVGGGYVALECAGFLNSLGYDTTVLVRNQILAKFDRQYVNLLQNHLASNDLKILTQAEPISASDNILTYKLKNQTYTEHYDTLLMAIGRTAKLDDLGLDNVGVKHASKIFADSHDRTNISNIYALGDCVQGRLELTPTAIMAGRKLINRLYKNSQSIMTYKDVATTIFTPLEYGSVGISEEDAIKKFGKANLKVYENFFKPVIWNISSRKEPNICQAKLIVHNDTDEVLGLHYLGPEAAEVIQGYSVAIKMGAKKSDFDNTVGIHPSMAEEIVQMKKYREAQ